MSAYPDTRLLLGREIPVEHLRAVFTAAGDWFVTSRDMHPDDYAHAAEGLRALPQEERDIALAYLLDDALMERASAILTTCNPEDAATFELWRLATALDPISGPLQVLEKKLWDERPEGATTVVLDYSELDDARERYEERIQRLGHALHTHLAPAPTEPATRRAMHAPRRRHTSQRPRARRHRSRRRAVARAGPSSESGSDGPGPAGLALLAGAAR